MACDFGLNLWTKSRKSRLTLPGRPRLLHGGPDLPGCGGWRRRGLGSAGVYRRVFGGAHRCRFRLLLPEALEAARSALEAEARTRSIPVQDFATTLSLAVASPGFVAAMQIGDGTIVVADTTGALRSVAGFGRGEYLNETVFLTSAGAVASAEPQILRQPFTHLALLSDGLQMVALRMPVGEPYAGFFVPVFRFLDEQRDPALATQALESFLVSPRLRERTDDDVTLLVARAPS
jgi:hypothetical protein